MRNHLLAFALVIASAPARAADIPVISSVGSGPWSSATTWSNGAVPAAGARVLIRTGHRVAYDVSSDQPLRSVHVAGQLAFSADKDTRLDVGLVLIQHGEKLEESGFDCLNHDDHATPQSAPGEPAASGASGGPSSLPPALEVGTPDHPIPAAHTATIRLVPFDNADKESLPAIVCCGGRMDFHGAPLSRTWLKLGAPAKQGDTAVTLAEPVTGWRKGDRVILTATTRQNKQKKTFRSSTRDDSQTEERTIAAIEGDKLTVTEPLAFDHTADGAYRGDVANLSRNVVVESADPKGVRGHTMYHRNSTGSIGYAEFRHLGKPGVLGRYSLHFHLAGDSMRGASVVGASIWDSGNRWITIHGTNYLVVRDCVGYQSAGHGFFLENGTEQYNVLDRNLAVQAYSAKRLPDQALPFDFNDGSGFWWANSMNAFTRNVAAECDEYGYFFQATATPDFMPTLDVRQSDGSKKKTDVRTIPFLRFDDNEAHCQRRHAFNLGGGVPFGKGSVNGVGPDVAHPFVVRDFRVWNSHWAIHPVAPSLMLDGLDCHDCEYGLWRATYKDHAYRNVRLDQIKVSAEFSPSGVRPVEASFPNTLKPVDDQPPVTVVTYAGSHDGKLTVRGVAADNGAIAAVTVNGLPAKATAPNFAQWELTFENPKSGRLTLTAGARDQAGNAEKTPQVMTVEVR